MQYVQNIFCSLFGYKRKILEDYLTCVSHAISIETVLFDEIRGDHESLDLRRAFVDLRDTRVPVMTFRRHIRHVSHPSQNL